MNQVEAEIAKLGLDVIPSLIANGLSWVIGKSVRSWPIGARDKIRDHVARNESVTTLLQKASASVGRAIGGNSASVTNLKQFLVSPELESILRQIYSTKLVAKPELGNIQDVRAEFALQLQLHLRIPKDNVDVLAGPLFEALLGACQEAFARGIQAGGLDVVEAQASLRHNIVLDELSSIRRNLDFLRSNPLQLNEILKFETNLRLAMEQRHGFIIPPNLSSAKKVPIDDLYVQSNFFRGPRKETELFETSGQALPTNRFWNLINRTVVLGNPGAGKSTFSQKLCHTLAKQYSSRPVSNRLLTPILVVLREYGAEKKERGFSILEFIESTANSRYQVNPPPGAIEYLLLNGRALVVFDGLDELLETAYRREITDDVEVFSTLYPETPVLVTSREVGYDQSPLDRKKFEVYRIAEFDDDQVRAYVTKWFTIDEDLSPQEKKEMPRAFLNESRSVADLRSNPLMLGLMCNIYRGEAYIPRNRPGVYEKCALMLFEKWDRSRRINVQFTFEDKLSPVMKHLAHWIYSDPQLQKGVTESQLIDKATEYLHHRYFEDVDSARKRAREFIEFCRGRAWIFTDTGSTEHESLYQFTHRTFLEYFTAAHLVRIYPVPEKLAEILIPKIRKREWDIVAQLAFRLQTNQVEGAGDALCNLGLRSAQDIDASESWATASFLARCLEFLTPSPKTVREITQLGLKIVIRSGIQRSQMQKGIRHLFPFASNDVLFALSTAAPENRAVINDTLRAMIQDYAEHGEPWHAAAALDIACHIPVLIHTVARGASERALEHLNQLSAQLVEANAASMVRRAADLPFIAHLAFQMGKIGADQLASHHGIAQLFEGFHSLIFPTASEPPADKLLKPLAKDRQWAKDNLESLGRFLASTRPPWLASRDLGLFSRFRFPQKYLIPKISRNANVYFAVFCLLAILLESFENRKALSDVASFIKRTKNSQINAVRALLLQRIDFEPHENLPNVSDTLGLSDQQNEVISAWCKREISFIGKRKNP